jgi:predicted methyltransferase
VTGPLLTKKVHDTLRAGARTVACSLDLDRSQTAVEVGAEGWAWQGRHFPFLDNCKDRTIYYWSGNDFQPVQRYAGSLIKLVPTEWGPPTFEIDGIKMLPTAKVSPYADAERKVALIQPKGKAILDTCGGLGYFAACCLVAGASEVRSFEKNADVLWLRNLNPWSPQAAEGFTLTHGDITTHIAMLPDAAFDAILHDPPRFGIAGELYSQAFYDQLSRVLKRKGRLFHYTGSPNKLSSGRDLPREVMQRLRRAGFAAEANGDGVLAVKK